MSSRTIVVASACLFTAAVGAASAQAPMRADDGRLPVPLVSGTTAGATFVSGGIGKDEADAMRAAAPGYALELVFVRKVDDREEFVGDVQLRIADAQDRVLLDRAAGPIVLAQLPAGTYSIVAEFDGRTRVQRVAVGDGRHEKVTLVWS